MAISKKGGLLISAETEASNEKSNTPPQLDSSLEG